MMSGRKRDKSVGPDNDTSTHSSNANATVITIDDDDDFVVSDDDTSTATTIVSLTQSGSNNEAELDSSYASNKSRLSIMSPIKQRNKEGLERKPSLLDHMRRDGDKMKRERESSGGEDEEEDQLPVTFSPPAGGDEDEEGGGDAELMDESELEDLKGIDKKESFLSKLKLEVV